MRVDSISFKNRYSYSYANKNNIQFKGIINDVIDFSKEQLKAKEGNKIKLRNYLKLNRSFINFYKSKINTTDKEFLSNSDEFYELKIYFHHANPLYMDQEQYSLDANGILKDHKVKISYRDDEAEFPLTHNKRKIKIPTTITIDEDKETGRIGEILNLDDNYTSKNCILDKDGWSYAGSLEIYDVNNCDKPEFRFLKYDGCDCAIFENIETNKNGQINADSLVTLKKDRHGVLQIKDIFVKPTISQPFMNKVEKRTDKDELNWRVTINSESKLSTINPQYYESINDYIKKSRMQINCREVYSPISGCSAKCDFSMEPFYEDSKEHLCSLNHKTADEELDTSDYEEIIKL